jgi:hypothetical protein
MMTSWVVDRLLGKLNGVFGAPLQTRKTPFAIMVPDMFLMFYGDIFVRTHALTCSTEIACVLNPKIFIGCFKVIKSRGV